MVRMHGKNCRAYMYGSDINAYASAISLAAAADTHDRTTFADAGVHTSDPGLLGWTGSLEAFYDSAGGLFVIGEVVVGSGAFGLLSVYDGNADAVGDKGVLTSNAVGTLRGLPFKVADLTRENFTLQGTGRIGLDGVLLHPSGAETGTGTGASVDNAASSANGGRGNLHVIAVSGTWTLKVQHSTDDSVWADLVTFTSATSIFGETKEVAGTVNRYLRATWTEDVPGTITFVLGFARY